MSSYAWITKKKVFCKIVKGLTLPYYRDIFYCVTKSLWACDQSLQGIPVYSWETEVLVYLQQGIENSAEIPGLIISMRFSAIPWWETIQEHWGGIAICMLLYLIQETCLPEISSFACAQEHSGSTQILAKTFTATQKYIYKGEHSDWVGQSVKEVVSSDPLMKPGYCPRGQNRNVTVPTISISLVWQHSSHEVRQGQNLCAGCVLALELGQLVSHFSL